MKTTNPRPELLRCPSCQAANPASRRLCDLCGVRLRPSCDAEAASRPMDKDRLQDMPVPAGWDVQTLPDGTVRMRRTAGGRVNSSGGVVMVFLLLTLLSPIVMTLIIPLGIVSRDAWLPITGSLFLGGLVLTLLVGVLWGICGQDELLLRQHSATLREALFLYRSQVIVPGANRLRITTRLCRPRGPRRYDPYLSTTLAIEGPEKHVIVESRPRTYDRVFDGDGPYDHDSYSEALGRYIAAQTGWQLVGLDMRKKG